RSAPPCGPHGPPKRAPATSRHDCRTALPHTAERLSTRCIHPSGGEFPMSDRLAALLEAIGRMLRESLGRLGAMSAGAVRELTTAVCRFRRRLAIAVLLAVFAYGLYGHP